MNLKKTSNKFVVSGEESAVNLVDIFLQDGPIYGVIYGPLDEFGKVKWRSYKNKWEISASKFIEYYLDEMMVVGKRFNRETSYIMIDIDTGSKCHPDKYLDECSRLLDCLKIVGLHKPVFVRSSNSGGIHLYYPFPKSVSSWSIAHSLSTFLQAEGFHLKGGQLEIFPNPKQRDSQYQGHRLPLQTGGCILDSQDFQPLGNDKNTFVEAWNEAKIHNEPEILINQNKSCSNHGSQAKTPATFHERLNIRFTQIGETNAILRKLVNFGIEVLKLQTESSLADWIRVTVQETPGYAQFVSRESKHDIEMSDWPERWATSGLRYHQSARQQYRRNKSGGWNSCQAQNSWNACQAQLSRTRLQQSLQALEDQLKSGERAPFRNISEVVDALNDYSLTHFRYGFSRSTLFRQGHPRMHALLDSEVSEALEEAAEDSKVLPKVPPLVDPNGNRVYPLTCKHSRLVHPTSQTQPNSPLSSSISGSEDDLGGNSVSIGNLGSRYHVQGNYPPGPQQQQHLALARRTGHRQGESNALGELGNACYTLGDYDQAATYFAQQRRIAEEIGDIPGQAHALGGLGNVCFATDNYAEAQTYYHQQLALAQALEVPLGIGLALGNLGVVAQALGNYPDALDALTQQLTLMRKLSDPYREGQVLSNLGNTYAAMGDSAQALKCFQQSIALAQQVGDHQGAANVLGYLGNMHLSRGEFAQVLEHHQQHLALAKTLEDLSG